MDKAFDLTFGVFEAWNQVGLMLGGLIMLLLGGVFLAYFLYWRLAGVRVRATVAGVRATGVKTPEQAAAEEQEKKIEQDAAPKASWSEFGRQFKKSPGAGLGALLFAALIVGVPLLFVGFGVYTAYDYGTLRQGGVVVEGTVIDNEYKDSDDGGSYHAVVTFREESGGSRTITDRFGKGGSPSYRKGETVIVHYDRNDPEHAVIGGFWHNMLLPVAFIAMGGAFLFFIFGGGAWLGRKFGKKGESRKAVVSYNGEMYYPLYEYMTPDGKTVRAEGDTGTNWLADKIPGMKTAVYMRPDDPESVTKPGLFSLLLALVFGGPGAAMLYVSVTRFETGVFTFIVFGALMVFLAFKAKKYIKPRAEWSNKSDFAQRRREKRQTKRQEGRMLTPQEIGDRLRYQNGYMKMWTPVLVLIAAGMIWGGVYLGQGMQALLMNGTAAEGRVVRIESSRDSDGDYTYYPVVAFQPAAGGTQEFRDRVGSNPSMYRKGETVKVIYDSADSARAMIDRGIWNWTASCGLLLGGLLLLWSVVKNIAGLARQRALLKGMAVNY